MRYDDSLVSKCHLDSSYRIGFTFNFLFFVFVFYFVYRRLHKCLMIIFEE